MDPDRMNSTSTQFNVILAQFSAPAASLWIQLWYNSGFNSGSYSGITLDPEPESDRCDRLEAERESSMVEQRRVFERIPLSGDCW